VTAPGERYLFPLRRRQSHADEAIVVAAACANRPSKEASSGSPVATFPRQTICLTGVFTNPKVDTRILPEMDFGTFSNSMRRMR
jgi:hypothetical protein